jgi:pterin-4a-carbinolamine dehydratase
MDAQASRHFHWPPVVGPLFRPRLVFALLQTHRVKGISWSDIELARQITAVALWKPAEGAALTGFPKQWVH